MTKFKDDYKKLNQEIRPREELINKTIRDMKEEREIRENRDNKNIYLKPVLTGCLVMGISIVGVPVLAESIKSIYELMYLVPEEIAEPFVGIEVSDIKNEIKLEVVAVDIRDNIAKVYITLEDLKGERIDQTIQLGSYNIKGIGRAVCGAEFYAYEEEFSKATFMITIQDFENDDILDSISNNLTFTLNDISITGGELNNTHFKIPLELESNIKESIGTRDVHYMGGSGNIEEYKGATMEILGENEDGDILTKILPIQGLIPNIEAVNVGLKGVNITAMTYDDTTNRLSIQYGINMTHQNNQSHGYIYLRNIHDDQEIINNTPRDSDINCLYSFGGVEFEEARVNLLEEWVSYGEYVFEVEREELGDYELYGMFRVEEEVIEGDWLVEFEIN
ncbi:MAG: hypothetical protein R3Y29_01980 [bacterium]